MPSRRLKKIMRLGAWCSFGNNVFSPYHVSGSVLGPEETACTRQTLSAL